MTKDYLYSHPMRVLQVYKTAWPDSVGGVEQVMDQLACGVERHGVLSSVYALSESVTSSEPVSINGYDLYRVKQSFNVASMGVSFASFLRFAEIAKRFDIIHYHFPWPFMDILHFACGIKKPALVTYHSDIIRQKKWLFLYGPLMHHFLSHMQAIVATSSNYKHSSAILQKYIDKVDVIPIGIDKSLYPAASEARVQGWKQKLGGRFFLFIGVMRYYKGLQFLLEAMARAQSREATFQVALAGEGPMEPQLRVQVKRLGLKNVHFLGPVSGEDKSALLEACYGYVFPSHMRSEAFGVSLLEGAMYGKPLISCEIGTGTTYINIHGQTGLVVPPQDSMALDQAMQYLIDNFKKSDAMGKHAERRYWQLFTGDQQAASYVKLYRRLFSKKDEYLPKGH